MRNWLTAAFLGRYGKSVVLIDGLAKVEEARKTSLRRRGRRSKIGAAPGEVNPLAAALALLAFGALMALCAVSIVEAVQAPAALLGGVLNSLP